ncbi:MAG: sugar porter family MFS transporter [Thermoguttaceae bacterium]
MNSILIRSTVVAALGGLLFGFDTAVISGTTGYLEAVFALDKAWLGFTVAIALLGTMVGALLVRSPVDRFGRRPTLILLAVLYAVSAIGTAFPWDWYSFLFFRFVGGLAVGGSSIVSPMYIAEVAPAEHRGRLVACAQLNIVLGILLAFVSNFCLVNIVGGDDVWRWMFGVEAIPAIAFFFLLFTTPESPRWLVGRRRTSEANAILQRLGLDETNAAREVSAIETSLTQSLHGEKVSLWSRPYTRPILLALAISAFNQLSGINAVLYYAPEVFRLAGTSEAVAMFQPVIIGVVNLLLTVLAMTLIDRIGRRKLMLIGSVGYIVSLTTAACVFFAKSGFESRGEVFPEWGGLLVLVAMVVFIASHAIGQGAVIWVYISEIFPNAVRSSGLVLAGFTVWALNAVVSGTFPWLAATLGAGAVFSLYAGLMVLQLVWVICVMPETRGVPLEEISPQIGLNAKG